MKRKLITTLIILLIAITIVAIVFIIDRNTNVIIQRDANKNFIFVGNDYDDSEEITIYKSYIDFIKKYKVSDIEKNSFDKYDYVLIKIMYDSCGEEEITPIDYKIENNELTVEVQYKDTCGGPCPLVNKNYVLKIDKGTKINNIKFDYKNINPEKCHDDPYVTKKPIIYLYPEEETNVIVKLGNPDKLTTSYPKYKDSWNVTAYPNGTLIDNNTNRELYGLYWEGTDNGAKQNNEGFVVKGEDTIQFLEEKLSILGLNDKEAEEFIVYWLPILEKNNYNYIRFSTIEEINSYMPLDVTPNPDTTIRILMNYKPLTHKIKVKEQKLTKQERKGFTLVEWGGSKIK